MVEEAVLMPSVTVVNWLLPLPTMDYELESHRECLGMLMFQRRNRQILRWKMPERNF